MCLAMCSVLMLRECRQYLHQGMVHQVYWGANHPTLHVAITQTPANVNQLSSYALVISPRVKLWAPALASAGEYTRNLCVPSICIIKRSTSAY